MIRLDSFAIYSFFMIPYYYPLYMWSFFVVCVFRIAYYSLTFVIFRICIRFRTTLCDILWYVIIIYLMCFYNCLMILYDSLLYVIVFLRLFRIDYDSLLCVFFYFMFLRFVMHLFVFYDMSWFFMFLILVYDSLWFSTIC